MPGLPPARQRVNERTASKKVSIIVPVYNVEPYLNECLASCVNQTLKEIEIICVNDGSTDRSLKTLKEFQKSDRRIRIIDKPNGGLSSARNAGIKAACGEWLVFLDADDFLAVNACERILHESAEGPTDIVVFGANIFPCHAPPDSWLTKNLTICPNRFFDFRPEILFETNGSIPFVWRQSFRRSFLLENELLFDEEIRFGEDTVFQLEAFPCANNFSYVSEVLYHYRWSRPGSLMATYRKDRAAKLEKHLLMMEHVCSFWKEKGWFSLYGAEFTSWVIDFIVPETLCPDVHNGDLFLKKLYHILEANELLPYLSESNKNAQTLLHGIQAGLFFRPGTEFINEKKETGKMEIVIQNLLLPQAQICSEEPMYFYREDNQDRNNIIHEKKTNSLLFSQYGKCTFSTYFNGLSISKWKKYTNIESVSLVLKLEGHFEINLLSFQPARLNRGQEVTCEYMARALKNVLSTTEVDFQEADTITIPYQSYDVDGILSFSLRAMDDHAVFLGGYYTAEVKAENLKETNIAINICTFKREQFILRNLDILRRQIIENESSPLSRHLQVYISDNGQTLPRNTLNSASIHIVANKNVGGAGGFTRGLMEILEHQKDFPATHALMMDDDIVICPESLLRTYALLRCRKDEYEDMFIGGAMMRLDNRSIQVESGASWNAGKLVSNKQGLDMRFLADILMNEIEEYTEFNAWWYCCIPMRLVNKQNLPMPIFIRGDDLEFGLRNMKTLVLMNGICVWHEPFENKYASTLYYYILRNLLYDNALHFPQYSVFAFLRRMYGSVLRELVYYRYKNVDLLLRGVNDFFNGVDFLTKTDGEKLHKEIMAAGYKALPVEQLQGAAFHLPSYHQSLVEQESRRHRVLRLVTLNGYLLPAKRYKGTEIKSVGMVCCRSLNFYRQPRVLNYDEVSGKGFVTCKSYKETFRCVGKLIGMTFKTLLCFGKAKKNVAQNREKITNAEFWSDYLDMSN